MNYPTLLIAAALAALAVGPAGAENARPLSSANGSITEVEWLTDHAVRITAMPQAAPGARAPQSELLLADDGYAFSGEWALTDKGMACVSAAGLGVALDGADGAVTVSRNGALLLSDNGLRTQADGSTAMTLVPAKASAWYGGGERGYARNLAGDTLVMYNKQNYGYTAGETRIKQMNITMPLVLSSDGYAVIFDDYAAARLIIGDDGTLNYSTEGRGPVSYVVVTSADGTLAGLTQQLTAVTGRQDLPPLWALGYITSKYGYKTEEEARQVIATLKEHGYPVDGIVLDLYWYGREEDMGRLEWDPEQWPTYKQMLADFSAQGVNTVAISQPYVLTNGRAINNYNELKDRDIFVKDSTGQGIQPVKIWVGEGAMFDVSSPATRQWLSDRYKALTLEGMGGWWGDLGEPEVHPETGIHANGLPARLYHNKYGNDWSKIIHDLFKQEWPGRRLMSLMRGGTVGLQRYSVFPWSTDVSRSWGGLKPQITIMLHSGLSGLGYMSHDVGGFAVDPDNPRDDELYVRWLQLGLFSPVLRTHAQDVAEPYLYTDYEADIILPLIHERYAWLPYNYTLAMENHTTGAPLVRPLNYYSGSEALGDIDDEYLWGRDLLVAPVLEPGATSRSVTFPEGRWLDYSNPLSVYEGGTTVADYPAPLEKLPLFVRSGAILPRADYGMNSTLDYRTDRYAINFYPELGVTSQATIYEDDLTDVRAIDRDEYALVAMEGTDTPSHITFTAVSEGSYPGQKAEKEISLAVYGVDRPASVEVDGVQTPAWTWDESTRRLNITLHWQIARPIKVTLNKNL